MLQDLGTTDGTTHGTSAQSPVIHLWFTSPDLGHPPKDDNSDRSLHQLIAPFLQDYLSGFGDLDNDDNEVGHLHVSGQHDSRSLAQDMLDSWDVPITSPSPNPSRVLYFDTVRSTGKGFGPHIPPETGYNLS